ncbi:MAG: sensor histidine kinase [bacterium]
MNEMLRHLLAIFRIDQESRRQQLVSLEDVAHEIIRTQAPRIEAKHIKMSVGTLPIVYCDEAQMKHVVTNLIDNAIKYVGETQPPEIRIGAVQENGECVVFVGDNGVGVPKDQQERIFNLYHRAPDQIVAGAIQPGDGVGLAICKRIVERWGGRIWVTSEAGRGSEFRFSVPVEPAQQ